MVKSEIKKASKTAIKKVAKDADELEYGVKKFFKPENHKRRNLPHNYSTKQLIEICKIISKIGAISLKSGAGGYRVKESMGRVANAFRIENIHTVVTLNEITLTVVSGDDTRTIVTENRTVEVDTLKIDQCNKLARGLQSGSILPNTKDINWRLDAIDNQKPLYPEWVLAIGAGLNCSTFAFIAGGSMLTIIAAFIGSFFGKLALNKLNSKNLNMYAAVALSSLIATSLYFIFLKGLILYSPFSDNALQAYNNGYFTVLLYLVPGFPFVSGFLDISRFDISSGIPRIVHSFSIIVAAILPGIIVSDISNATAGDFTGVAITGGTLFMLQLIASYIGVVGFSITFNSPIKMVLTAGFIGMSGNALRLELLNLGNSPEIATFFGALLVGLLVRPVGHFTHLPRIALSVPSVLVMMPGMVLFKASTIAGDYGFNGSADMLMPIIHAIVIAISIPLGLIIARILTDPDWTFT
ncbi:MAG: threonine/serine exporter family protein [Bifidobacteriaceae bacterium]|jgi:uncharacterized membrane protein YjjP (DUF1212 family)|nr:threonine/serine exporter family protein [Bifidobacteriaceae bacterium]